MCVCMCACVCGCVCGEETKGSSLGGANGVMWRAIECGVGVWEGYRCGVRKELRSVVWEGHRGTQWEELRGVCGRTIGVHNGRS